MSLVGLAALAGGHAEAVEAELWLQLQQGGHVILMRHGAVDNFSRSTGPDADFEGCEGQYNLTELGRAQALRVGDFLRKRKVAIGGVLASPLCRTRDTARIAFGSYRALAELEPLPEEEGPERARRIETMSKLIISRRAYFFAPDFTWRQPSAVLVWKYSSLSPQSMTFSGFLAPVPALQVKSPALPGLPCRA